jgi:hypothetical protein
MNTLRLLLPFTHGIDMGVLEYAVRLAKSCDAILVPLSLIQMTEMRWSKGARLEYVQQSKDFLEAMLYKAAKHGIPVERFEVFTSDVVQSIGVLAQQVECDGILLFVRGRDGILLRADEVEHLVEKRAHTLYIFHLAPRGNKRKQTLCLTETISS